LAVTAKGIETTDGLFANQRRFASSGFLGFETGGSRVGQDVRAVPTVLAGLFYAEAFDLADVAKETLDAFARVARHAVDADAVVLAGAVRAIVDVGLTAIA
jgi:hypothetical protein